MPGARARSTLIGLALTAGPILFAAPLSLAQDYIDVEAERRAAQQNDPRSEASSPTWQGQGQGQSASGASAARSYGMGNAPAAASTTRTLPPPPAPAADNVGGLFNQVQQLQQEVMRLNGIVEQQAYEIKQLKEQSLERYLDLDRRLAGGGAATGMPAAGGKDRGDATAGSATSAAPSAAGSRVPEQPGEAEAYRAAYALVRGQEFDAAVDAFTAFLRDYPDGRFAPNAHYWLGELYLVVDPADPEAARQSFTLLLNEYPDNAKVPDALYKLGRVQYIKGNSARAREYLDRVIREYPDSSAARLARDFKDQNL